ncbi:kinase-like domain-containing protein [Aspergillus pseudonomiae]|uniref:Kinase-like domain-containing protein n=1 Tax=Aspergillus pseudonomiae TaxID=1506151 RepID=A0A5N7D3A6_9EURO|nr:kinase-like domain-containing protein [Aspergillus pseudonomiae]KAB8260745.1 kinase-like domain-containing protein [Aspergillus pseudonomiae]KAE8400901.1 kinase-like domain-containing protein [Aspergillus pseudonomiae]
MSMFRSPADFSSESESEESSLDRGPNEQEDAPSISTAKKAKAPGTGTKSPPLLEGSSYESLEGDTNENNELDVDTEVHSNMMTAALLEFYCLSRAADILNAQEGSHKRYTRDSPEVQYLGRKMYNYKSRFLSSHGVIAGGIEKDELRTTRQYYRDNLDVLGMSALEDLNIDDTQRRVPPRRTTGDIVLASKASNTVQRNPDQDYAGPAKRGLYRPSLADIGKRLPSTENIRALENVHLDVGSLPSQSLHLAGSSPASFPLFESNLPTPHNHLSRYATEFAEVKVLGRGSFGEVYHVKNHIDGQPYAVKKIPISQRRLEQLQDGNENQLENIMKEIRTLARLEHTNVVRYYGAWVEQAHVSGYVRNGREVPAEVESENTQSALAGPEPSDSESFGVVFEYSQASAGGVEDEEDTESIPRDFDAFTNSQVSTFGGTDDDIFTDGLSYDPSKLQIQRRHRGGPQVPAVVLHIQMSLHPISLSSYLNSQPCEVKDDQIPRRHCYHLAPSLRLMLRIISGVEYLHSKGIVHRDLKPANIFLSCPDHRDSDGCSPCQLDNEYSSRYSHPRIGDFGLVADISHLNEHQSDSPSTSLQHNTKVNHVVGTEFYRPPLVHLAVDNAESSEDTGGCYKVDESLDVFALGVILFELLYRLNTKMERQFVLGELTRCQQDQSTGSALGRASFPCDFAQKIDLGEEKYDGQVSIAEELMTCISGMLEPLPQKRWSLSDVKQHLHNILTVAQRAPCP